MFVPSKFQPGSKDKLLFVHIPKCGGTTFRSSLFKIFGRDRVLKVWNSKVGSDVSIQEFSKLNINDILKYPCITGHLHYKKAKEKLGVNIQQFFVCALVRDPVDHVLSYWNYVNTNYKHPFHQKALQMSFQEFVENANQNQQCKFISGRSDACYAIDTINQEYDLVLPLKYYNQFFEIVCDVFEYNCQGYEIKNQSKKVLVKGDIKESTIALIEKSNSEDKILHEHLVQDISSAAMNVNQM